MPRARVCCCKHAAGTHQQQRQAQHCRVAPAGCATHSHTPLGACGECSSTEASRCQAAEPRSVSLCGFQPRTQVPQHVHGQHVGGGPLHGGHVHPRRRHRVLRQRCNTTLRQLQRGASAATQMSKQPRCWQPMAPGDRGFGTGRKRGRGRRAATGRCRTLVTSTPSAGPLQGSLRRQSAWEQHASVAGAVPCTPAPRPTHLSSAKRP